MRISVCIATHNGELYIFAQLQSILSQLCATDEVIISDDSSTDDTIKIVKAFADSRIKIFENNSFKSPVNNFENALKFANGEYIFLSDQDDIWLPDRVEKMLAQLKKSDLVVSDCKIVDSNLKEIEKDSFMSLYKSRQGFINNIYRNSYIGCCMAFNRKILNLALPFPANLPMHDWWIGLICEVFGKSVFLDEQLLLYRRHQGNVTNFIKNRDDSLLVKVWWRIIISYNLITRYSFERMRKLNLNE